eukprot:TRINITY_DN44293_c0_g1_i1.p1 TRINITY_DN44293_c0_g1~~TRINITY_DN44293_c0_g1_i1.p1  ORF type:complete len:889 (+),score=120.66 TRINITY_DN44293_c0_g1_i1:91-2667(+)
MLIVFRDCTSALITTWVLARVGAAVSHSLGCGGADDGTARCGATISSSALMKRIFVGKTKADSLRDKGNRSGGAHEAGHEDSRDAVANCEWARGLRVKGVHVSAGSGSIVDEHLLRLGVWASLTEPRLAKMRQKFPAVSEDALRKASIAAACNRCASFMPKEKTKNSHHDIVRGMAKCIRKHDESILSNVTHNAPISGIPEPNTPCRKSVVSGELLVERDGLKLADYELGPHRDGVACAAEIPLLPTMRVPMMFSSKDHLMKHCTASLPSTGISQWNPWCRVLLEQQKPTLLEGDTKKSNSGALLRKLVEAGAFNSEAADGGVVRPSALSLDQDDAAYFGLFRIRNASYNDGDLVSTCTDGNFPECFYTGQPGKNSFYPSAWRSLPRTHFDPDDAGVSHTGQTWYKAEGDDAVADATDVCCSQAKKTNSDYASVGCSKFLLSSTCPLLADEDRRGQFARTFENCLHKELNVSSDAAHWTAATLSRHLSKCCRPDTARTIFAQRRNFGVSGDKKMCDETECPNEPKDATVLSSVLHTYHFWDQHYFHALFEGMPSVLAWRKFLGKHHDTMIRASSESPPAVGEAWQKSLDASGHGIRPERMLQSKLTSFASELLLARVMPATAAIYPHAQLFVPFRALLCTAAVNAPDVGMLDVDGGSYRSVWELAIKNPAACANFKSGQSSGNCYSTGDSKALDSGEGVLKVLLAEHGPGMGARTWDDAKHIVHEAIGNLSKLLPSKLRPRAVVVADVLIGSFPPEAQRRSFADAHVVVGGLGSQLSSAICMQPGSFIGAIHTLRTGDAFLWNQVAPFGIQYWTLMSSNPIPSGTQWPASLNLTPEDERSLQTFIETALTGAASMLVH